jgi:RNA polymerase sigma factor (TIGR02999 family)
MTDVTRILNAIEQGDPSASDKLLPLVYEELRGLARQRLANEKPGQTLQATALVHEAYLRLIGKNNDQSWDNRGHFFAAAAEAMRRILVNRARDKSRLKRGGDRKKIEFDEIQHVFESDPDDLIDLDDAIEALAEQDPIVAQLVKLRFFAGLEQIEAAKCLHLPKSTADRYWSFARVWLFNRLRSDSLA